MKKQVNYKVFKDMEKYIPDFDPESYIVSADDLTDPMVIEELKKFYDENLPVDVEAWARVNISKQEPKSFYDKCLEKQIKFVVNKICKKILYPNDVDEWPNKLPMVCSYFYKSGQKLPVYLIKLNEDIDLTLSNDFYSWKVKLKSDKKLNINFIELLGDNINMDEACTEFPKGQLYGNYGDEYKKITFSIVDTYDVYVIVHIVNNYLKR